MMKVYLKPANIFFLVGIMISVLIIFFSVYKIIYFQNLFHTFYYTCIFLSFPLIVFFIFGIVKFNDEKKINISLFLIVSLFMIYSFETLLNFFSKTHPDIFQQLRKERARQLNVAYDERTKYEVLQDLKLSGHNIFPNVSPVNIIRNKNIKNDLLTFKNNRIFPLGGISNTMTIFGNESGYYPICILDEHGFNNPKGNYNKVEVDIMLLGDSFVEGYSVNANETIGAFLRKEGFNAINIGKSGNESLVQIASLKEYVEPMEPDYILWFYFNNDLLYLDGDKSWIKSPILKKYLDDIDFSQNLIMRQEEIDSSLVNYVNHEWEKEKMNHIIIKNSEKISLIKILKLYKIRLMIGFTPEPKISVNSYEWKQNEISEESKFIFKKILNNANQMVSGWNGKLYFVYLPTYETFLTKNKNIHYDFVIKTANELNIPIIDIKQKVFDIHSDPLSFFPFRLFGHYNADGYKIIGETISDIIKNNFN